MNAVESIQGLHECPNIRIEVSQLKLLGLHFYPSLLASQYQTRQNTASAFATSRHFSVDTLRAGH